MKNRTTQIKRTNGAPPHDSNRGKLRSDFPKHTLDEALRVAQALEEANGGQPYPPIETATALGLSPGNSEFRILLSSSIKYGLTTGSYNSDKVAMQELGRKIVEPRSEEEKHASHVDAALAPPTFRAIYDYFKGKKLPSDKTFFENTVVREFGVPREHAEKCVSVFGINMERVGLVRVATTGRWLSTEIKDTFGSTTDLHESPDDVSAPAPPPDHSATSNGDTFAPVRGSLPKTNAIFLGHGKNRQPLEQLSKILDQYKIPYRIAVEEPNSFRPISAKVAETMQQCAAAILIFTSDEEFRDVEGNVLWRPSENVVYELGAASVLYGGKIIIFKEEGVNFPSNFRDVGHISFDKDSLAAKTNELFRELISFGLISVTVGGS
jgi:predicted nucleotide-binding protein